ncbi:MAG: polyprenyl synthetase family protein, partial [Thermoguttaceae bacterium]
ILAGDALLARAFELLATVPVSPACCGRLIADLAARTGWRGMIGGQAADIDGEKQPVSVDLARYIHERKTAALFQAACRLGAIASGGAEDQIDSLGVFGLHLGVAFQIADDLLDVCQTDAQLGKRTGKDAGAGKQSFPRCVGIEGSRAAARKALALALECLESFGPQADDLRRLASYVVDRNY